MTSTNDAWNEYRAEVEGRPEDHQRRHEERQAAGVREVERERLEREAARSRVPF